MTGHLNERGEKRCNRCREWQPLTAFQRNAVTKDGLQYRCRSCQATAQQSSNTRHADAMRTRQQAYRAEQRERLRLRDQAYSQSHRSENVRRSQTYARRHPDRVRARERQYRASPLVKAQRAANQRARYARTLAAFVEHIDVAVLAERDHWRCGICQGSVTPETMSVDHIYPLIKGGAHSYANTQLAHLRCNVRKGATVPAEAVLV